MRCPFCDNPDTRVLDSRQTEDGHVIRRRRICDACGKRFTTYEKAEISILMIVKKDGRREAFDRQKVAGGIIRACEKRPVSMEEINEMAARIERKAQAAGRSEVTSDYIGELVMDELRAVDQVAYIRFASVYRQFANVEKFAEEIDKLRQVGSARARHGIRIAIDGPSGAGKSTIAKRVAARLGFDYIDTGAMYRSIGLKMARSGFFGEDGMHGGAVDPSREIDPDRLSSVLAETEIDFREGKVYLDGEDVESEIRNSEISKAASACAQIGMVREKLVDIQREIGSRKNVVMDGRDIGTNVFRDAEYKFFLTAAPAERAKRRFLELKEKGQDVVYEDILKDVEERDYRDTHRELNPLRKAEDAVEIDSTHVTIEEVVDEICSRVTI